jgi:hypothetical protein
LIVEYPEEALIDDEAPDDDFELLQENQAAVEAFFMLDGCAWQFTGMGALIGLDYQAADIIWRGLGVTLTGDDFQGVMLFSKTIANLLNKD